MAVLIQVMILVARDKGALERFIFVLIGKPLKNTHAPGRRVGHVVGRVDASRAICSRGVYPDSEKIDTE